MIKKENRFTINFSEEAIFCLQVFGFLNKLKKHQGKNISKFVSKAVVELTKITYPIDYKEVKKRVIIYEINELTKQRNKFDRLMEKKINELKSLKK